MRIHIITGEPKTGKSAEAWAIRDRNTERGIGTLVVDELYNMGTTGPGPHRTADAISRAMREEADDKPTDVVLIMYSPSGAEVTHNHHFPINA